MGRNDEGSYYSVDLGGTSFRVMKLELGSGSMVINKKVEHRPIPEDLTKGTSEVTIIILFQFLCKIYIVPNTNVTLCLGFIQSNCLGIKELY